MGRKAHMFSSSPILNTRKFDFENLFEAPTKTKKVSSYAKRCLSCRKINLSGKEIFSLCFQEFQVVLFVRKLNYINKGHNYHQGTIIITEKGK